MKNADKQLKRQYKETARPMGVFQIRNTANEKVLIAASLDLPGNMNRHRFQLERGIHANLALQTDWSESGSESFAFEILDELSPYEGPQHDYREDLLAMERLWLEEKQPFGGRGYNEPKLGREDRLKMIAANNRRQD